MAGDAIILCPAVSISDVISKVCMCSKSIRTLLEPIFSFFFFLVLSALIGKERTSVAPPRGQILLLLFKYLM